MARVRGMRGVLVFALLAARPLHAAGSSNLAGSPASMLRQHEIALAEHYSFSDTPAEVRALVASGLLQRVPAGEDYVLSDVSFPYARAEVLLLIERLATPYRASQREPLVVTSLTRPTALQPVNAHALSVHPAGMAVDFRVPASARGRVWLERALLVLERAGVLDVTREQTPAHYHVAVYPAAYRAFVSREVAQAAAAEAAELAQSRCLVATAPAWWAAAEETDEVEWLEEIGVF